MNTKLSNISFSSKYKFISNARYRKITGMQFVNKIQEISEVSKVNELKNVNSTDSIIYCLAGTMKDKFNNGKFFHFFPKDIFENGFKNSQKSLDLEKTLNGLKDKNKFKFFIIGGLSKADPFENWLSIKLINILKKPFKKISNIDATIFFSQNSKGVKPWERPKSAFIYSKKYDTYYINCQKFKNNSYVDLLNKNEIRNHFDFIHISPKSKVIIENKDISHSFLNKNRSK